MPAMESLWLAGTARVDGTPVEVYEQPVSRDRRSSGAPCKLRASRGPEFLAAQIKRVEYNRARARSGPFGRVFFSCVSECYYPPRPRDQFRGHAAFLASIGLSTRSLRFR